MKTTQNTKGKNSNWTLIFSLLTGVGALAFSTGAAVAGVSPPRMQSSAVLEVCDEGEMAGADEMGEMKEEPKTGKLAKATKAAPKKAPASPKLKVVKPKAKSKARAKAKSPAVAKAKATAKENPPARKVTARASKKNQGISQLKLEAKKLVSSLTTTQRSKLLALLNDGDPDSLTAISGVGNTRSSAIVEARPFTGVEEIRTVKGVGSKVFADVVTHGKTLTRKRSTSSASKSGKAKRSPASTKRSSSSRRKSASTAK